MPKKKYTFNVKLFIFISVVFLLGSYVGGFIPKETWPAVARDFWPVFCCLFGGVSYFIGVRLLNLKNK